MLWLFGALPPGHPFYASDPGVKRRRLAELQASILVREGRRHPVLLVVEDLQWVDSDTQAALESMARDMPRGSLLVLTHRPEHEGVRTLTADHRRLDILPLPPSEAERLLDGLVGTDPTLGPVKRLLVERTEGNPLFLEECVRSLVETGGLVGGAGGSRLGRPVSAIDVPSTVRAVLEARIDRLPFADKRLLQAAAVVGEQVPATLVEIIADLPPDTVRTGLGGLRASGLLREVALFPEIEYAFNHSLTHDVAYEGLLHDQRRALHGRLVDALEQLDEGDPRRGAERLAHHALRGGRWEAAVRYCRDAGRAALGRGAYGDARTFIEASLDALGHLEPGPDREAVGIDLRFDLSAALVPVASHARSLAVLGEAETLAALLGDERRLARALSLRSANLWHLGESDEAVAAGRRAVKVAERLGDLDLQVMSHYSLGGALRTLGDHREAVRYLRRNLTLLAGPGAFQTFGLPGLASVLTRGQLGWSLAELGEFEEALAGAEEAIRIAEQARHPYTLAHAYLGLGGVLLRRGGIGEAMAVLERGLAACEDAPALFPPMAGDLAVVYALSGRMGRALELGEQAFARAEATGRIGRLALIATHVGEVNLLAGRLDEADGWGCRALDLARSHQERGNQVYALRLLGLTAAERHSFDPDAARARFEEAIALATELGVRPLLARCHLALGRLGRRVGDAGAAARHLAIATELFRAMGMTFWLERLQLDRVGP
jgi:tetratricopeptide (TPR) repeat protein